MARCTARNRQGEQCGQQAIRGATVCRFHGGKAPQVGRAVAVRAAQMRAYAEADRMVARAGVDADPIEHLLESLYRAAALVEVWGQMAAALDAKAQEEAIEAGDIRGELGYAIAGEDSYDELRVWSRDRLLALTAKGEAQVHPFVHEYQQALERRARFAKLAIDAGVAERQVRITEEQGKLIARLLHDVLTDLDVMDRPEAPVIVRKHLALMPTG